MQVQPPVQGLFLFHAAESSGLEKSKRKSFMICPLELPVLLYKHRTGNGWVKETRHFPFQSGSAGAIGRSIIYPVSLIWNR